MTLLLAALVALFATGLFALAANRWQRVATGIAAAGAVSAGCLGFVPALTVLRGGPSTAVRFSSGVPVGELGLGLDPLSAFFLVPVLGLGALSAVYGLSYMRTPGPRRALGPPAFFFNMTLAAMILVLLARHAVVLLAAWEVMTLASYLLVTFEHNKSEVRRAGWVYLVAGHLGVLFLFGLSLVLGRHAGGLDFAAYAARPAQGGFAVLVLALATIGFGVKAGVVPLHVWLPEAHAAAPSHVSALMSGALIKLGLYGLLRTLTFVEPASWRAPFFLTLGVTTGLFGISMALHQRDLKRVLAYSSIENMGVILIGLGIGLWGATAGHPRIAALGLCGALLHIWNHAAMKGLMFLAAGSILHSAGSKDIEHLGGLLRRMPWTGSLMIVGAVAIAGFPPLNGFASEWLIYMGLFHEGIGAGPGTSPLLLFLSATLATVGVLASFCFVRAVGITLLGQPRSVGAADAHEAGIGLLGPIVILTITCAVMAMAAHQIAPILVRPADQVVGFPLDFSPATAELARVGTLGMLVWLALFGVAAVFLLLLRRRTTRDGTRARESEGRDGIACEAVPETWGCGYVAPTARMQYTGRSFSETLAERLLPPPLGPRVAVRSPREIFPGPGSLASDCTDPLTRSVFEPFFGWWAARFSRLRWLQQGVLHAYLVYILLVVVVALAWASARRWWGGQ